MISTCHVPRRTTLSLKNRYATLRSRHENKSKRDDPTGKSTLQTSGLSQSGSEIYVNTIGPINQVGCDNTIGHTGDIQMLGVPETVNLTDESEDEEDDDDGSLIAPPAHYCGQLHRPNLSAAESMAPPTPGSWLGANEQDHDLMTLFSNNGHYTSLPNLNKTDDGASFEPSFLATKPPCLSTDPYSFINHSEHILRNGKSHNSQGQMISFEAFSV